MKLRKLFSLEIYGTSFVSEPNIGPWLEFWLGPVRFGVEITLNIQKCPVV
jgi:hypothetical protein